MKNAHKSSLSPPRGILTYTHCRDGGVTTEDTVDLFFSPIQYCLLQPIYPSIVLEGISSRVVGEYQMFVTWCKAYKSEYVDITEENILRFDMDTRTIICNNGSAGFHTCRILTKDYIIIFSMEMYE